MKKTTEKQDKILMSIFAACAIVMEAAMARAFLYGLSINSLVHAAVYVLFFALFAVFAHNLIKRRLIAKTASVVTAIYCTAHVLATVLLIGFLKYIPALILGMIDLSLPFWFFFSDKNIKKSTLCVCSAIVILFVLTIPGYFRHTFEQYHRIRTAPLYISAENGYFEHAKTPEKLYVYTPTHSDLAEILFHNSLQAYTCRNYTDQIVYASDTDREETNAYYTDIHLALIQKYFPEIAQIEVTTQSDLLDLYDGRIENYILYDDEDRGSIMVAANLCYQHNAVMIGKSMRAVAENRGWTMVFDASGWDEKKLMESPYFDNINKHFMYMIDPFDSVAAGHNGQKVYMTQLWDNAILNNAWIVYNDLSIPQLEKHLAQMDRNSICWGSVGTHAENAVVQACARYSATFVYTRYTANLSVLSGIDPTMSTVSTAVLSNGEYNKLSSENYSDDSTPKHTVCVMVSDGDNVRFCTEQLVSASYYRSPLRDEGLQYNCGIAGTMVEIAPILLLEYYDIMHPTDDFCYQLSSLGYTYPSKWADKDAWEQVTKSLTRIMKKTKTNVLEIMDDSAFMTVIDIPANFSSLRKYFDTYTQYDEVDGCLFIDYNQMYAGYRGAVCWSNDKPVVSAKYSVWYDEGTPYNSERNTIEFIAAEINEASTDKTDESAYTFIIVHGWSGLDADGNLVGLNLSKGDVDNTAIFKKLDELFDDDVEMVTVDEFIDRMRRNVKR